jgi:uncharacterized phage protein (TIGR01671 family)
MREIKFRFWSKFTNSFLDNYCAIIGSGKILSYCFETEKWGEVAPDIASENLELSQFTGCFDRNNKEIYEGDICEFNISEKITIKEPVVFENSAFHLATYPLHEVLYYYDLEILGNIYENPGLLEKCK